MSATDDGTTHEDIIEEVRRLVAAATVADVRLRVLGGVAIAIRCPGASQPPLARRYGDIDTVSRGSDRRKLGRFLQAQGYQPLERLNAVYGKTRLFYRDPQQNRRLDVFLDRFEMCHDVDLRRRLELPGPTLPLADLLVSKLQVVETTEKDLSDISALLNDHDLTEDDEGINVAYLARLAGNDWGLWQTIRLVAERARKFAAEGPGLEAAAERAGRLLDLLAAAPKSRKWAMRARVGERVRWYKLPEEPDFS